ncbi:MAG: hypothetical protein UU61_C0005G0002 [Parcubacteria group bacterium GW2011_GWB1_41_4]|nr:MAG: hypothetical protein UU61_C0005G0002 [Parcubacteria group bacterium GW2011_GWB1_41_4]
MQLNGEQQLTIIGVFILILGIMAYLFYQSTVSSPGPSTEKVERMKILSGYRYTIEQPEDISAAKKFARIAHGLGASQDGKFGTLFFESHPDSSDYAYTDELSGIRVKVRVETANGAKPVDEISQFIGGHTDKDINNCWYQFRAKVARAIWLMRANINPKFTTEVAKK